MDCSEKKNIFVEKNVFTQYCNNFFFLHALSYYRFKESLWTGEWNWKKKTVFKFIVLQGPTPAKIILCVHIVPSSITKINTSVYVAEFAVLILVSNNNNYLVKHLPVR